MMSQKQVNEKLNTLLADSAIFYQKLRNYHWNVKGESFFELHLKFEELYTRWAMHIDEIAERILMSGSRPLSSLSEFLERGSIKEQSGITEAREMVEDIVSDFQNFQQSVASLIRYSESIGDRKTTNMLDAFNDELEKDSWMFRSWLG